MLSKLKKISSNLTKFLPPVLLIVVLAIIFGLSFWAAKEDSETTDEAIYVGHSYRLWHYGDWRLNPEHPPFLKILSGIPLRFMDIQEPGNRTELTKYDDFWYDWWHTGYYYANHLLYAAGNDADSLLFATRTMVILQFMVTLLIIYLWIARISNPWAGLISAITAGFAPIMLAHAHYYTPDVGGVMLIVLSLYLFYRWWEIHSQKSAWWWLILFSFSIGLSIASRYSCLILIPVAVVFWLTTINRKNILKKIAEFLAIGAIIWLTMWLAYGAPTKAVEPFSGIGNPAVVATEKYNQFLKTVAPKFIPSYFVKGLILIMESGTVGRGAYLLGRETTDGWWFYFPIALLLKMPIPLMLVILLSGAGTIYFARDLTDRQKKTLWVIGLFLTLYTASVLKSKMNLGVRYVLPMIPLAVILIGIFFHYAKWMGKVLIGILIGLMIWETILIAPRFIVYFNQIAGGWQNGWKYLLDSNIDWGQDVKRLKKWLDENGVEEVVLDYEWKTIPLDYYGIKYALKTDETALDRGYLAISVSRFKNPSNQWIYQCNQPETKLGGSLYVYDLSKTRPDCPELKN